MCLDPAVQVVDPHDCPLVLNPMAAIGGESHFDLDQDDMVCNKRTREVYRVVHWWDRSAYRDQILKKWGESK